MRLTRLNRGGFNTPPAPLTPAATPHINDSANSRPLAGILLSAGRARAAFGLCPNAAGGGFAAAPAFATQTQAGARAPRFSYIRRVEADNRQNAHAFHPEKAERYIFLLVRADKIFGGNTALAISYPADDHL